MSKPVYIKILLLTVLALALACKKEVDITSPVPEVQTIHYKASVQTGASTKATVGSDLKYKYEAGDRVYMESEDGKLYGFLSMTVDAVGNDAAVFEGELSYEGETPSAAEYINNNPAVKLVLVSKEDDLHTITEGKVADVDASSYPKDKWAGSLEEVVSHLSHFTGTGHFNDLTFTLNQQSSFLKCFVRLKSDQAPVDSKITAKLLNNNDVLLREASIDVKETGVVPFVFAFLGGESLTDTKLLVKWGDTSEEEKSFDVSNKKLASNTYYNISRSTLSFDGFRIRATQDNTIITFNYNYQDSGIEYSLDYGESWNEYTSGFELNKGEVACFRGNRENYKNATKDDWESPSSKPIFAATRLVYISGNIMSLLANKEEISESAFHGAFSKGGAGGTTQITYIDIDPDTPLILPDPTLAPKCYAHMFRNCTSLTRAPQFRVESTAVRCCYNMFRYCNSLEDVSDISLPAMSLSTDCYRELFRQCSKLKKIPVLPAPILVQECYRQMLSGSGITEVTCLATDISATDCLNEWMSNVGSKGTFYKAPGVDYPRNAHGIPSGWTVVEYSE